MENVVNKNYVGMLKIRAFLLSKLKHIWGWDYVLHKNEIKQEEKTFKYHEVMTDWKFDDRRFFSITPKFSDEIHFRNYLEKCILCEGTRVDNEFEKNGCLIIRHWVA